MSKPEHFTTSVILIMLYTLFVIIVGACLAATCYFLMHRKDKEPISLDDYGTLVYKRKKVK